MFVSMGIFLEMRVTLQTNEFEVFGHLFYSQIFCVFFILQQLYTAKRKIKTFFSFFNYLNFLLASCPCQPSLK